MTRVNDVQGKEFRALLLSTVRTCTASSYSSTEKEEGFLSNAKVGIFCIAYIFGSKQEFILGFQYAFTGLDCLTGIIYYALKQISLTFGTASCFRSISIYDAEIDFT